MALSRRSPSSRLSRDASRLTVLAAALNDSGCRLEDRYWENRLDSLLEKLLRSGHDETVESALDALAPLSNGAYEILLEQAETLSESTRLDKDGVAHDVLLVAAPVVAWTRYKIPQGPIASEHQQAIVAQMHGHVLAQGTHLAIMPQLLSIDEMPQGFSQTLQWLQRLGTQALGGSATRPQRNEVPDIENLLADTRYLVMAVAAPVDAPIFRWQELDDEAVSRESCATRWREQIQPTLAAMLPGCVLETLLPDAYYLSNREADRRIRPVSIRAAVTWLTESAQLPVTDLRAVIVGCGESRVDEYRVGFTSRSSNDVYYGVIWPLYGNESEISANPDQVEPIEEIAAALKDNGIQEVRRLPGLLPPEYCEDCGAPYFPNPLGELVHAELPEDVTVAPAHFH